MPPPYFRKVPQDRDHPTSASTSASTSSGPALQRQHDSVDGGAARAEVHACKPGPPNTKEVAPKKAANQNRSPVTLLGNDTPPTPVGPQCPNAMPSSHDIPIVLGARLGPHCANTTHVVTASESDSPGCWAGLACTVRTPSELRSNSGRPSECHGVLRNETSLSPHRPF